jgi:5'-methylthioadenosine phosphorylase
MSRTRATIAVIGGSGASAEIIPGRTTAHRVSTPWGSPSSPVVEGELEGLRLLFLERHGPGHSIPPHRVNYRANVDALRSLGAEAIVTVSSVGSLQPELPPGSFVLPSQFIDFTKQRPTTFFDGGRVYHVSTADPFCPDLLVRAAAAGRAAGHPFAESKNYVCVEGPRFSTRAESRLFRTMADVIGMTLVPEVTLARERGICYVCLAMVTDYDVWSEKPVDAADVVRVMNENSSRMGGVLQRLLPSLRQPTSCECPQALANAVI